MKQVESTGYQYQGMVKDDQIRQGNERKLEAEYIRKLTKLMLYAGNIVAGINTWALYMKNGHTYLQQAFI